VEEQLHLAATMWTAQMLKEPLQHGALDIALGARAVRVQSKTLNILDLIQDLKLMKFSLLIGRGHIVWLHR
jgi:hypothetical protein